jgi:hypothetical protein
MSNRCLQEILLQEPSLEAHLFDEADSCTYGAIFVASCLINGKAQTLRSPQCKIHQASNANINKTLRLA